MDEESIVNPIDAGVSDDEKVRQLQKLSAENDPIAKRFLEDIDRKFKTESDVSHKDAHKIIEKAHRPSIKERKPWHEIEHIRDAFRFKTVLEKMEDLAKIAEDLMKSGIFEVVKVDTAKVLRPGPWGWRIPVFDLRMPNGQLVEYYCPVKELEAAKKDGNHDVFEKWRDVDEKHLSKAEQLEYVAVLNDSYDKYDRAWDSYLDRTKDTPERVREILDRTERILSRDREKSKELQKKSVLREKLKEAKDKGRDREDDLLR